MGELVSFKWRHLADLPPDVNSLANPELVPLRNVWLEQKESLEESGLVTAFTERLIREYAIEGGIIERAYTLDRGITEILIERGIDADLIPSGATNKDPRHVALTIQAHQAAVECVFAMVKDERALSTSGIKELHAILLRHESVTSAVDTLGRSVEVPLLKGEYKRLPNNPRRSDSSIHEYCPPEHVSSEMDRIIELHRQHSQKKVAPEVEAAWLHHVFTQVHPFQDGNGRVARLLATFVFIKSNYFPLTLVDSEDRDTYIRSLEQADLGDLKALTALFSLVQRRTFVKVLGIAGRVEHQAGIDQVIAAAKSALATRKHTHQQKLEAAKRTARILHVETLQTLEQVARKLNNDIGAISPDFRFRVDSETNEGHRKHYFRNQLVETAKSLDYFANIGLYHDWCRLILRTEEQAEVLISFHGIGYEYRGVIVCSVGFFRRAESEAGERETTKTTPGCDTLFQINYIELADEARARFTTWLNDSLTRTLEIWRSTL